MLQNSDTAARTPRGETDPPRRVARLARALAPVCRGATYILEQGEGGLVPALDQQGVEIHSENGLRTVILDRVLDPRAPRESRALLQRAWARVPAGGRLVVVAHHREGVSGPERERAFRRRKLRKLLSSLGKPKLVGRAPYRWLAMTVDRPRDGAPVLSGIKRDRLSATARQCHGRVIELGCGEGELTAWVARRGCRPVGVDISRKKIETARRRYPDLEFIASDVLDLEQPAASFDTVVLAEILEHVPPEVGDAMLERAWNWLTPEGRLVVSVPNEELVPHANHLREFDRAGLKRLLGRYGRPRTVSDQPIRWLLMTVRKQDG